MSRLSRKGKASVISGVIALATAAIARQMTPCLPGSSAPTRHLCEQPDDVLARPDVAENPVESRQPRLVQSVRQAGQRVRDHDDLVVEFHCVPRRRHSHRQRSEAISTSMSASTAIAVLVSRRKRGWASTRRQALWRRLRRSRPRTRRSAETRLFKELTHGLNTEIVVWEGGHPLWRGETDIQTVLSALLGK